MDNVSIRVEHLSKKYNIVIGQKRGEESLAERLTQGLRQMIGGNGKSLDLHRKKETVWSVQDVSFEIKPGEVVGIIGRNGAGKSTLLKLLSRITEPTSGRVEMFGRVGTLLEVGTGFHPELTGRDNIYLSGIILGMKKTEIDTKFDEIVDFSGIDKYIDTPVKRYSSGMYVRLAFAVGAYLDPEILIVDEVLAVGDSQFQKRCLAKMKDIGAHGRTVLFVSHNMNAISRLCSRVIYLREGRILQDGHTQEVIKSYLNSELGTSATREWTDSSTAPSGDIARLCAARVRGSDGSITESLDIRHQFILEMEYEVLKPGHVLSPHFHLINEVGELIFITQDLDPQWRRRPRPVGQYRSQVEIPGNFLTEGTVFVGCHCITLSPDVHQFSAPEAIAFHIADSLDGDSARGDYAGVMPGVIRPLLLWSTVLKE